MLLQKLLQLPSGAHNRASICEFVVYSAVLGARTTLSFLRKHKETMSEGFPNLWEETAILTQAAQVPANKTDSGDPHGAAL